MLNPLSILGFGLAQARTGFVCAAVIAGSSYTRVPCCGQNFVCVCERQGFSVAWTRSYMFITLYHHV